MIRFDHLRIPVTDLARSRGWYVDTLRLRVEFEVPDRGAASSSRTVRASRTGATGLSWKTPTDTSFVCGTSAR